MIAAWFCLLVPLVSVGGFVAPIKTVRIHNHQNADRIYLDNGPLRTYHELLKTELRSLASRQGDSKVINKRKRTGKTNSLTATSSSARLNYRRHDNEDTSVLTTDSVAVGDILRNHYHIQRDQIETSENLQILRDPSMIEFVGTNDPAVKGEQAKTMTLEEAQAVAGSLYPFASMMQGSAAYIAAHAGKVVVFHIPGELVEDEITADHLLSDIALCWLLGMKVVIVCESRYDADGSCALSMDDGSSSTLHPHECHNTLRITDAQTLRVIEEEAGFLRTEIERKLNRFLKAHGASSTSSDEEGNVVSGNFYTAQNFGLVRGEDFQYTGYTSSVHKESIMKVMNNNDIVLLSTVGLSPYGELVNVNGYHLAATVASSLEASKIIYVANEDSAVLRIRGESTSIQELPLSFSKSITGFHQVKCHNTGFATFERARKSLDPGAVELLLHLGWSNWALDRGVRRAHIVNPSDGALLEELFTSKNGANTCLYHDEDGVNHQEGMVAKEDWDDYFESASDQVMSMN